MPARQLPDKAVSLLDTASARVAVSQHSTPAPVEDRKRRVELLNVELEIAKREAEGRYNAGARIGPCLASAQFADEILVVDSGSTDDTLAIAERHGARVEVKEWLGFGRQKQYAVSIARNDWATWDSALTVFTAAWAPPPAEIRATGMSVR